MKILKAKGIVEKINDIMPEHGGEPFIYRIRLNDGCLAFVLDEEDYFEISSGLKSPESLVVHHTINVGDAVDVEYIEWSGQKVVVAIDLLKLKNQ